MQATRSGPEGRSHPPFCRRSTLRQVIITIGPVVLSVLVLVLVAALATIAWDYSQVPSREAKYDQLTLGMSEEEVIDLLGPPGYSRGGEIEGRFLDNHPEDDHRQFKVTTSSWAMNH